MWVLGLANVVLFLPLPPLRKELISVIKCSKRERTAKNDGQATEIHSSFPPFWASFAIVWKHLVEEPLLCIAWGYFSLITLPHTVFYPLDHLFFLLDRLNANNRWRDRTCSADTWRSFWAAVIWSDARCEFGIRCRLIAKYRFIFFIK